jgi:hypothetical protein
MICRIAAAICCFGTIENRICIKYPGIATCRANLAAMLPHIRNNCGNAAAPGNAGIRREAKNGTGEDAAGGKLLRWRP